ncbi:helix-turn-helix transcriptional regulator (plasmid) [Cupriavidus sp. KK10]|nr:helix-turn-helix transcriptional regulator [Cupriavidus sp. KK10]
MAKISRIPADPRMRWRLLNSALKLVASKGHAAMSVDDVIREAGVSRGTFYKYFASPDVLIRELATEIASQIVRTDGISAPIEDRIRE